MASLLSIELLKTYRKLRTYIGFGVILVVIPLIYLGMSYGGENMVNSMTRNLQKDFVFVGNLFNGWFVSNMVMNSLWVHIPFLIALVAGDMFAGEATGGTFRILLTRPPSRTRIFFVKLAATIVYTYSLVIFLGLLSIGLGLLLFGTGDLLMFNRGIVILPGDDVLWRFILAYFLAGIAMVTVASLALMLSTFVENAIGPIIGTMAVVIAFFIFGNLDFSFFKAMRPWLFTTYLDVWKNAFTDPVDWNTIAKDAGALIGFSAFFSCVAWSIFSRKNIVS